MYSYPTEEITTSFRRFGPLVVDWPHKAESKSYFPPKGMNQEGALEQSLKCVHPVQDMHFFSFKMKPPYKC